MPFARRMWKEALDWDGNQADNPSARWLSEARSDRPQVCLSALDGANFALHPGAATPWTLVSTANTAYQDCDGIYRVAAYGNEVMVQGACHARNLFNAGMSVFAGNGAAVDAVSGVTVAGNGPDDYARVLYTPNGVLNAKFGLNLAGQSTGLAYRGSFYARLTPTEKGRRINNANPTGYQSLTMANGGGLGGVSFGLHLTEEWQRFSSEVFWGVGGNSLQLYVYNTVNGLDHPWMVDFKGFMMEFGCGDHDDGGGPAPYIKPGPAVSKVVPYPNRWKSDRDPVTGVVTNERVEPLHPVTVDMCGQRRAATYNRWQASTAYAVGDRVISNHHYRGPAGGDGFFYECITAGTTGASVTLDDTLGNTTNDGTVVWRCAGEYKLAGLVCSPLTANLLLYNEEMNNAAWTGGLCSPSALTDCFGNKRAWDCEDDNASATEVCRQDVTITNNDEWVCFSVFVRAIDSAPTSFPRFSLDLVGGTAQSVDVRLDHQTGDHHVTSSVGTTNVRVDRAGNYWRINVGVKNNNTGNVTAECRIIPADSATLTGSGSVSNVGTITLSHPQCEEYFRVASFPIPTAGAGVGRVAVTWAFNEEVVPPDSGGMIFADVFTLEGWDDVSIHPFQRVLGGNISQTRLYLNDVGSDGFSTFDGTNVTSAGSNSLGPVGTRRAAARWTGVNMKVTVNGNTGLVGNFDGSFDEAYLQLGGRAGGSRHEFLRGFIRNLFLFSESGSGNAWVRDRTEYD